MLRSELLGQIILQDAVTFGGSSGRSTTWGQLQQCARVHIADCGDGELVDALKRLQACGYIALQKWSPATMNFRPPAEYPDENAFFFRGDFRILVTSEGRSYCERLTVALGSATYSRRRGVGI